MEAFINIDNAIAYVEGYQGTAGNFRLPISNSLLDPSGMNMAIITDKILGKGFMPDGFEQKNGYRVFKYKPLE